MHALEATETVSSAVLIIAVVAASVVRSREP
jgi:hypothetical protein